jgi:hypothetical protein
MLFREIITVYSENYMNHRHAISRQNTQLFSVKARDTFILPSVLKI